MPTEAGHRLYVKGRHLSYQRGKRNTTPGTSLIQIEGVNNTEAANFYLGKKVAFVYRASKEVRGSKIRVIWGKIARPHGNSGVVRARFRQNLPPKSFGASLLAWTGKMVDDMPQFGHSKGAAIMSTALRVVYQLSN
ncbi:hypothetical protein EYC84_007218 [Monilinia fructicola]|uniref:Ribosomal protein L35Ae n=1 Tax=Monilinia fructicola TaxID=38448 RepID=A0A5M9K8N8_MONFR|nr:hypothetical protein EYC84_007218 [Monilinia fructicola]